MSKVLDNRKKIELTITLIGIIFLIFMVVNNIQGQKGKKSALANKKESSSVSGAQVFSLENFETKPATAKSWGRDPFLLDSTNAGEQGMGGLILNGIVSDKDTPYAIINNDIVKLGDKVNGMAVIEINEKNVVLDENGQRHTLELNVY